MGNYELLKKNPYYLSERQIDWVKNTIADMSIEEKIGQLFCGIVFEDNEDYVRMLSEQVHIGGWMGRPLPMDTVIRMANLGQKTSKIPLLIAANFEAGGDGLVTEGTNVGPNLQIGATGDAKMAAKQAYVCAKEGVAVGANYAFAPVIDINYDFQNPIMGTRLFGEDAEFVAEAGKEYTQTAQELGMAVSIKHFPGDGVDYRDQHLVTSVNSLSCEEWDESFGKAYQRSIDAGALTVMAGHIMQPAYSKYFRPDLKDEDIMPATLAPELLNDLLRKKLGFNGMIITDSSTMAGMCIPMRRSDLVPAAIAAGCDMFLFTKDAQEDFGYMMKGYQDGVITEERLEDALIHILGVKAALKLPEKKADGSIYVEEEKARKIVGCEEHKEIELACADKAVTLVKSKEEIFPVTPEKYKRILLYFYGMGEGGMGNAADIGTDFKRKLEKRGFQVNLYDPGKGVEGMLRGYEEIVEKYDMIFYIADLQTKSNQTTVRIEWKAAMGGDVPVHIHDVPTVFISFANPYHLQDVPRVKTYINAYKFKDANIDVLLDKLMGKSEFKGVSPVDAFCGLWDTRL